MSKWFVGRTGGDDPDQAWEAKVRQVARHFSYPPTPDLAEAVRQQLASSKARLKPDLITRRRWAWAALLALFLVGSLLAVPQVRAAVVEFLQLGAVRIFLAQPVPTVQPTPVMAPSLLGLAGETSLAEARTQVDFPIRLPTYPAELGPPDRVFQQDFDGPVVILVWLKPEDPGQVWFSLHLMGPDTFAGKGAPQTVTETMVNGRPALWLEGPHLLQLSDGDYALRRLVEGHVLLWTEGQLTYRLETDLPLAEAVRVAESLE